MRILIATDAWHPQVNGVVRTLTSLARAASGLGAEITFLTPEGFPTFPLPTYPEIKLAIGAYEPVQERFKSFEPEAIHIATEGTIGWAVRSYCLRNKLAFTTSYTTRFPEYVSVRTGIPDAVGYWVMRRFHDAAAMTMVATNSLRQDLAERGFKRLGFWTRGVDTELFHPDSRPSSICRGRSS
jgi:glycosyltransferase involved in cell wall biosynthesis